MSYSRYNEDNREILQYRKPHIMWQAKISDGEYVRQTICYQSNEKSIRQRTIPNFTQTEKRQ